MKFRSISLAAIAGSLIAGSAFAQGGTPAAQPAQKPVATGETAKIETKSQDKASTAKSEVAKSDATTTKAVKGEPTKMAKKHKHADSNASAKQTGSAVAPDTKHEAKKEMTSSATMSTTTAPKAGATATTSGK